MVAGGIVTASPERLSAYLKRIAMDAPPATTADGLRAVQLAHRTQIAFENLDVMLGRPILIDAASAFEKLVMQQRGGYCFEHNQLFADMLAELGFPVRPLMARVNVNQVAGSPPPRTHVLLLVEIDDALWIADAGFGGSYVPPMPLINGSTEQTADGARHRLRRNGTPGDLWGEWLLERAAPLADGTSGDWQAQHSFHLAQVAPMDLEQANHWTSTRANTRHTTIPMATIALADGFIALTHCQLSTTRQGVRDVQDIAGAEDYRAVLSEIFGIALSTDEVAALPLFAPLSANANS